MSNFSDTFELPASVTINGEAKALKPLSIRDYLPWCAELVQKYRERNKPLIPPDLKSIDRMKLESQIEAFDVSPDDIRPLVFLAPGTIRVLRMSYARTVSGKRLDKLSDQEREALYAQADDWIDELPAKDAEQLAVRLSALFTADELVAWYQKKAENKTGDKPDPNAVAAQNAAQTGP